MEFVPPVFPRIHQTIRRHLDSWLGWIGHAGHNKLHLGCGSNIIPGWTNVDLSDKSGGIRWDLTRPLPVGVGTVDFIFSEHFIEHISRDQAKQLFRECHRVLRIGGVLRISTPDLNKLVSVYLNGSLMEWADLGWNPATPCALLNEGMRLWGHQYLYDVEELTNFLRECGFEQIAQVKWHESRFVELTDLECRPFHDDLILECVKRQG